jgi:hypothetical protein
LIGTTETQQIQLTVVGMVGDVETETLDQPTLPHSYTPVSHHSDIYMELAIRTSGDPMVIARQTAAVVQSIDPEVPIFGVQTMEQGVARTVGQPRFETTILGFFAAAALFLAAIEVFWRGRAFDRVERRKSVPDGARRGLCASNALRGIDPITALRALRFNYRVRVDRRRVNCETNTSRQSFQAIGNEDTGRTTEHGANCSMPV